MNVAPKLYRRGNHGIWWADFGEVGGIRHRRSTGHTDEQAAIKIAAEIAKELQHHQDRRRLAIVAAPTSDAEWSEKMRHPDAMGMWERMWKNARSRAMRDGLLWSMSFDELIAMAEASVGRCAVTNLPFSLAGLPKDPFKPSIDRIDNSTGYSRGNCRLTLMAVNYAMNVWGEDLFAAIALSFASHRLNKEAHISHRSFSDRGSKC